MFSKITICTIALMFFNMGCGLNTGDHGVDNHTVTVTDDCFNNLGEKAQRYVYSEMSVSEVNAIFNCGKDSLIKFSKAVSGKEKEIYSAEELRKFLHHFFIKDHQISDELLHQMMLVKQLFLTGSDQSITKDELNQTQDFLNKVQKLAVKNLPFMKIYNLEYQNKNNKTLNPAVINQAIDQIPQLTNEIAELLNKSAPRYEFSNMVKLVNELQRYAEWKLYFKDNSNPQAWVDLIRQIKVLALGSNTVQEAVLAGDWRPLLNNIGAIYQNYLRAEYFIKGNAITEGEGYDNLKIISGKILELLKIYVNKQNNKVISTEQVQQLIESAGKLDLLPGKLTANTLKTSLVRLFAKMFGEPTLSPEARLNTFNGIELTHLSRVENEFGVWMRIQNYVNKGVPDDNRVSVDSATQDFINLAEKSRNAFLQEDPRVYTNYKLDFLKVKNKGKRYKLTVLNVYHSLGRLLFSGFSSDIKNGLQMNELQNFFTEFEALGLELELMDPCSKTAGIRSYYEANVFTFSGDGSGAMSMPETLEFIPLVYSSGYTADLIREELSRSCVDSSSPLDVYGYPRLNSECFKNYFYKQLDHYISNLPRMVRYLKRLSVAQRNVVHENLLQFAVGMKSRRYLGVDDVRRYLMVLIYTEVLINHHDLNQDGSIDSKEMLAAFPVFRDFLKKASSDLGYDLNEGMLKGAFLYILVVGKIPDGNWYSILSDFILSYAAQNTKISDLSEQIGALSTDEFMNEQNALSDGMIDFLIKNTIKIDVDRYGIIKIFPAMMATFQTDIKNLPAACLH